MLHALLASALIYCHNKPKIYSVNSNSGYQVTAEYQVPSAKYKYQALAVLSGAQALHASACHC